MIKQVFLVDYVTKSVALPTEEGVLGDGEALPFAFAL